MIKGRLLLEVTQNPMGRLLSGLCCRDRIALFLKQLHWPPVCHRVQLKVLLLTYVVLKGLGPGCLKDCLCLPEPPCNLSSSMDILCGWEVRLAGTEKVKAVFHIVWCVRDAFSMHTAKAKLLTKFWHKTQPKIQFPIFSTSKHMPSFLLVSFYCCDDIKVDIVSAAQGPSKLSKQHKCSQPCFHSQEALDFP